MLALTARRARLARAEAGMTAQTRGPSPNLILGEEALVFREVGFEEAQKRSVSVI